MKLSKEYPKLGRQVAFYPSLSNFFDSVKVALLVCQLGYWQNKQRDPTGFIYKTRKNLQHETGLTRAEQETARRFLKRKGYLEEKRKGIPARMFYRVNWEKLMQDFDQWLEWYDPDEVNAN